MSIDLEQAEGTVTETDIVDAPADAPEAIPVRDEEGRIDAAFLQKVEDAIEAGDETAVRELAGDLHEADLGDLLEALGENDRPRLVQLLGGDFDFAALTELDEAVRVKLIDQLPAEDVAEGIGELDSDDAVYILEDLEPEEQAAILNQLSFSDRIQLQRSLDYPEESAGRLMQTDFIAVPPFWTVGQTIDHLREDHDLPDTFYEIYVVDPAFRLLGAVALDKLLRTKRSRKIAKIMTEERQAVAATEDREEVARLFERYNLVSAAVVDEGERLVGVLTIDDIVDVIQEEAEEDLRALAGVGDEEISDTVMVIARSRLTWLIVNLATAVLASVVISLFENTIEAMVALAVLMPIVASMGGNAGTQTMTVAVRAIATQELGSRNFWRVLRREVLVAILNGVALALLMGLVAGVWFANPGLGLVIGTAIIVNQLFAGLAGLMIPIILERLEVDPAIASSVFVTTVTDVVGFFAFLGIAALWFGLPF
ncbi:magnesium transporter [Stappia sp. F7233]|uniref:Magnesium transporter MgtE n=1 Tax=Stappia albiluteola TaxID=2758565 RepID=A0A839AGS7_9HYPH|nr:magnesium transporter [Stappia albiluteola]MBA5777957.1 magnesium transporter [Stappia albiluteola]